MTPTEINAYSISKHAEFEICRYPAIKKLLEEGCLDCDEKWNLYARLWISAIETALIRTQISNHNGKDRINFITGFYWNNSTKDNIRDFSEKIHMHFNTARRYKKEFIEEVILGIGTPYYNFDYFSHGECQEISEVLQSKVMA